MLRRHVAVSSLVACGSALLIYLPRTRVIGVLLAATLTLTLALNLLLVAIRETHRARFPDKIILPAGIFAVLTGYLLALYSYLAGSYWVSLPSALLVLVGTLSAGFAIPRLMWREFQEGILR